MAEVKSNGAPPTDLARQLTRKDFSTTVSSLSEARVINRQLIQLAVGQFDPEYISLPRLYQMRRDPMIQMGLHYSKAPLVRAKWHIECERRDIAAGVEEIIRRVYGPYMRTMLNKYDFGFQAGVKQFKLGKITATYEDPESGEIVKVWDKTNVQPMVLGHPIPLPPDYTTVKLDDDGKFNGISTSLIKTSSTDDDRWVPPEFAIWATNEFEETFLNYYGYPRTGYAYRYWWSYWFRFHMEDRHFEMDADPALQVWYPPGQWTDPANPENTKDHKTIALELGSDLRGGATVAWPSNVYIDEQGKMSSTRLWEAAFLQGGENLQAFRESADYLDIMKLRSILVPEQALVEGKGGTSSRNVAATYGDIFTESLGQEAEEDDNYWTDYVIPQIVEANWGADAPRARKVTTGFEDEDLSLATELIKLAFQVDPNALPINFEELVRKANLPVYSAKEQQNRQEEAQQMQAEAQQKAQEAAAAAAEANGGTAAPATPSTNGVAASQEGDSKRLILYQKQHGRTVTSNPPQWARREGERRHRNTTALAERLEAVLHDRYTAAFDEVSAFFEEDAAGLSLGLGDVVKSLTDRIRGRLRGSLGHYRDRIRAEMASMFHASGAAEINRLGLDLSNWDVGRDEVQGWAEARADEVIDSMDDTIVEVHVQPELLQSLATPEAGISSFQLPYEQANQIAADLRTKFKDFPDWMAKRTARTEARRTYNGAGFQIWDWAGVGEVQAYDGLGGLSGQTDEECLARNGQRMTLAEARKADAEEHPNGTLGFVPVIDGEPILGEKLAPEAVQALKGVPPGNLRADAVRSNSIYAVDDTGLILSQQEVALLPA